MIQIHEWFLWWMIHSEWISVRTEILLSFNGSLIESVKLTVDDLWTIQSCWMSQWGEWIIQSVETWRSSCYIYKQTNKVDFTVLCRFVLCLCQYSVVWIAVNCVWFAAVCIMNLIHSARVGFGWDGDQILVQCKSVSILIICKVVKVEFSVGVGLWSKLAYFLNDSVFLNELRH